MNRVPVSMGAVSASEPTVFESVGASRPMFFGNVFYISIDFHNFDVENITNIVIPWPNVVSSTQSLKFLTGGFGESVESQ